jgi:hypothetical protein
MWTFAIDLLYSGKLVNLQQKLNIKTLKITVNSIYDFMQEVLHNKTQSNFLVLLDRPWLFCLTINYINIYSQWLFSQQYIIIAEGGFKSK